MGVLLLAAAIWGWVAYRQMRRDRDMAHHELLDARRDLEESRRELSEAHRALDQARREWQEAVRKLTARLDEHEKKTSEVIGGLRQWQADRKKLGLSSGWEMRAEAVIKGGQADRERPRQPSTGLRTMFDRAVNRTKHLIEQARGKGASGSDDEAPVRPD